ncbi:YihY/virulence factor BrkB family protein [Nocardioides marmoribigeumensis]|uniref:Membrane protein n=1 Tax=Nocardioides marmoribigeumensis TaxID=433649 RepID=A0ABU2BVB9_9ACTN|nr:YihY/virulence factor BrkB family protein [Nocardioides marmoribigeumensis]MDR7362216.1 membrane protein [Nocardioides marmoribigeumensis]
MTSRTKDETHELDPDAKPEGPTDLTKRSWKYVLRKTWREFGEDQCTDKAAALTYYSVLALFPAALALLSIIGLVANPQKVLSTVMDVLRPLVSPSTLQTVQPTLESMASSQAAGVSFVVGLAGALWSASGYIGAFSRAMNSIYEIDEGRPFWKLRPIQVLITLVAVLLSAAVLVMLVVSGPLAESIGNVIGLGSTAVLVWSIAKWPVLALTVVVIVALLYYATPNVKQPKFRWISVGAAVAIVTWVLVSVVFGFYVANFSSYDKTYGSIAGVVVFLLWLWLTNLSLLFGAEIDSELERGRELQAGIPAEEELQLPPRDDRNIEKAREKEEKDIALARQIREAADPEGRVAAEYDAEHSGSTTDEPRRPDGSGTSTDAPETTRR